MNKIFVCIFSTLILAVAISCNQNDDGNSIDKSTNDISTTSEKIQTVEVVLPKARTFQADIQISGTAQPNQRVTIYSMESGMVIIIRKDIGDHVGSGEVLATLSNPIIQELMSIASAELLIAQADIKTAEADMEAEKVRKIGLQSISDRLTSISQRTPQLTTIAEVEQAVSATAVSNALIQSKQSIVNANHEKAKSFSIKLEAAKTRNSYLQIKAPFSGIITKRHVDKGSLLQSGMTDSNPKALFEIQSVDPMRVTLPVPESDAVAIKKGMSVNLVFPELSGQMYTAEISRTSGVLDPMSKTMQVEIDLENKDGNILSGMYAKANLELSSRSNILSLPLQAKTRHKNEDYVLAILDETVVRIPVKIGFSDAAYFEVLNGNITESTQVIIGGKGLVNPGQKVRPILK